MRRLPALQGKGEPTRHCDVEVVELRQEKLQASGEESPLAVEDAPEDRPRQDVAQRPALPGRLDGDLRSSAEGSRLLSRRELGGARTCQLGADDERTSSREVPRAVGFE